MHVRQPFFWKDYHFVNVFTFLFQYFLKYTLGIKYFFRQWLAYRYRDWEILTWNTGNGINLAWSSSGAGILSAGKAVCACGLAPLDRTSVYI